MPNFETAIKNKYQRWNNHFKNVFKIVMLMLMVQTPFVNNILNKTVNT